MQVKQIASNLKCQLLFLIFKTFPRKYGKGKFAGTESVINNIILLVTVRTLVRFLSSVDLPVSVQTAGICQQFTTLFTLDCCLAIGSNHVSSGKTKLNLNKESLTKQTFKALKNNCRQSTYLMPPGPEGCFSLLTLSRRVLGDPLVSQL